MMAQEPSNPPVTQKDTLLSYHEVTKTFEGMAEHPAIDQVSLSVRPGLVTGLAGPDGAGKTTLIRLAAGLLAPDSGHVTALGLDTLAKPFELRSRIGYMPQQFGLYQDLTIRENLDLYADLQGVPMVTRKDRFQHLLEMSGLSDFVDRLAGKLSGGMKQKLGLACSLIKNPELLLLDEPTVGVDPVSRRELWEMVYRMVKDAGVGVLLATAYLDEVDQCDEIVVLDAGKIVDSGSSEHFHQQVSGRVFALAPVAGVNPRTLQSHLMRTEGVLDATVRSGKVRVVMATASATCFESAAWQQQVAAIEPMTPNFEDAFMALPRGQALHVPSGEAAVNLASASKEPAIVVKDLVKQFGNFTAVHGIRFEVGRGEIFGLLGPNGAGKTTTFRMLCGLMKVSGGEVRVAGKDLRRASSAARSRLGYMAQLFSLYRSLSVLNNLRFYGQAYGLSGKRLKERIDWALDEFGLDSWHSQNAGDLPGGYRQRLAMATAMLHEPEILFLDEPTSGADPLARREFWLRINRFAEAGVTVLVTTHFMEEAEYCDRMIIMSRGTELAQGRPAEIRAMGQTDACPDPTIEDAFITLAKRAEAAHD
jgi:ABC-2 type transport system ATP-binding protein